MLPDRQLSADISAKIAVDLRVLDEAGWPLLYRCTAACAGRSNLVNRLIDQHCQVSSTFWSGGGQPAPPM